MSNDGWRTPDDQGDDLEEPEELRRAIRDEDERGADELLEVDQVELAESGLLLDDPHQPEPE